MTSSDNELLVRIYEGQVQIIQRLDGVEHRLGNLEARVGVMEAEQKAERTAIQGVQTEQKVTNGKLDMMQHMVYWGVALLGLFIAFVAWIRPKETPSPQTDNKPSRYELEGIIRDVVRDMQTHVNS